MAHNILLIEDEMNVGLTLKERLQAEGYRVTWAKSGAEALLAARMGSFDLGLVDVGLPDGSGFDLASQIKIFLRSFIYLTAFGSPEDRVRGLELGADDYIVKPFHLRELLLRVKRRLETGSPHSIRIGKANISFDSFEAEIDGSRYPLSTKERSLLELLVRRSGETLSREEILEEIWPEDKFPTTRTVDNFIVRLRKLIERNPEYPEIILSVRGVGYRLNGQK